MIPRAAITSWRANSPWNTDAMVEQDLIICRAMAEIFSHPELGSKLIFRGGTALHKLYLCPATRYSEDIDLVQDKPGPIGPIFDAVREKLSPWLGEAHRKQGPDVTNIIFKTESEVPPISPLRLKIEINSREHFHVMQLAEKPFEVSSNWFNGECRIVTYCLEELLGTKMRALYQRRKGRDLYDIWLGLTKGNANKGVIVQCFNEYMRRAGAKVSRKRYLLNVKQKMGHPDFLRDTENLLRQDISYDMTQAYQLVREQIIDLLD